MSVEVDPQDLRFTQDSIAVKFKSPHDDTRIDYAVDMIRSGKWSAQTFPTIDVVKHDGQLWSLDNRRLWVFRQAQLRSITVNVDYSPTHPRFLALLGNKNLLAMIKSETFLPRVRGQWNCKTQPVTPHVKLRQESQTPRQQLPVRPSPPAPIIRGDHVFDVPTVNPVVMEKATEEKKSFVLRWVSGKETMKPLRTPESIFLPGEGRQSTVKPDVLNDMPNLPSVVDSTTGSYNTMNIPPVDPVVVDEASTEDVSTWSVRCVWKWLKFACISTGNGCYMFVIGIMRMIQYWFRPSLK